MTTQKRLAVLCSIALLAGFLGTWIASDAIVRVGEVMQETWHR